MAFPTTSGGWVVIPGVPLRGSGDTHFTYNPRTGDLHATTRLPGGIGIHTPIR